MTLNASTASNPISEIRASAKGVGIFHPRTSAMASATNIVKLAKPAVVAIRRSTARLYHGEVLEVHNSAASYAN
jgi:hypothetical protein